MKSGLEVKEYLFTFLFTMALTVVKKILQLRELIFWKSPSDHCSFDYLRFHLHPLYLHMPPVDLVDDLQVARKQVLEEVDGPALQGFRQNGVVGVGTGTNRDVPSLDTAGTGDRQGCHRHLAVSYIMLRDLYMQRFYGFC